MGEPKRIPVVTADGEYGTLPENELSDNLSRGAVRLADPKEIHEREIQKKYGDREVRTAIESGADALTFGLHSKAMQYLGLETEEEQQGQREANPTARTVGEIVGMTAPLLIPGGGIAAGAKAAAAARAGKAGSTVARLAQAGAATVGALPRGIAAAGKATANVVNRALGGGANTLAGRALAHGLGAAAEGALIGGAQAIEEDVIGESELTAEKLASSIGYGALTGGAIGAGATVAGAGLSAVGRASRDAAKKLLGKAGKLDDLAAMESWQSTLPNKKISGNLSQEQKIKYGRIALDENVTGAGKNVESIYTGAQSKLDEIGPQLGELNRKIDALDVAALQAGGKGFAPTVGTIASRIEDEVLAPLSKSSFDKRTLRTIKGEVRDYLKQFDITVNPKTDKEVIGNAFAYDRPMSLEQLHADRVRLDANTKWDSTVSPLVNDAKKQIRGILSDEYKKAADKITDEFGENAGKQLRQMNERYEAFSHIKSAAEDTFNREQAKISSFGLYDRILGGTGAAVGAATMGLPGAALGYATAKASQFAREQGRGYVATALDKLSRNQALENMALGVDMKIAKSLGSAIGTAGRLGAAQQAVKDTFTAQTDHIRQLAADNQTLINNVSENTQHLAAAAPATTTMLGVVASRATQFLNSKLPPETMGPMGLEKPAMSKVQKAKFQKYQDAVSNPMSLLDQIEKGNVQPETVEAVKAVYPKMYSSIQQLSMMLIGSQPQGKLNEKRKVSLSYALGIPLTKAMAPGFLANAKGYVTPQQKEKSQAGEGGPGRKGSQTSRKRIVQGTQTEAQRLSNK